MTFLSTFSSSLVHLYNFQGTEAVEVIVSSMLHLSTSAKVFSKMTNLRLLIINSVQLPEGLEYLSNELRMLEWHGYPSKSLPSNSQLDKLIELNMHNSDMEQMWEGVKVRLLIVSLIYIYYSF